MDNNLLTAVLITILIALFLYFGYREDYKNDKNNFKRTVFGIFGVLFIVLALVSLKKVIDPLFERNLMKYYRNELGLNSNLEEYSIANNPSHPDFLKALLEHENLKNRVKADIERLGIIYWLLGILLSRLFYRFLQKRYAKT